MAEREALAGMVAPRRTNRRSRTRHPVAPPVTLPVAFLLLLVLLLLGLAIPPARAATPPSPAPASRDSLANVSEDVVSSRPAPARDTSAIARADTAVHAPSPVTVELEGIPDEGVRKNVLGYLSIAQEQKKSLPEGDVRTLHGRAEGQIQAGAEPFGYYRVVVHHSLAYQQDHWLARYQVDLGPQIRIDTLDVRLSGEGAQDPAFVQALQDLPLRQGDPLIHSRYELSKAALTKTALDHGYLDAHYEERRIVVDLEAYRARVVIHYATGIWYAFGPVQFQQTAVDPRILQGYASELERGKRVDFNRLLELETRLSASNYWSRVEVRPRTDLAQGREAPIVVDLVPARRTRYVLGAGYGTDNGPFVQASLEFRRLNRRGHRASVQGMFSQVEKSGSAQYNFPWPYPRTDVFTLLTGYGLTRTVTSEERGGLAGVSLARAIRDRRETYSLIYQQKRFVVGIDTGEPKLLIPKANLTIVHKNHPVDPTEARRVVFEIETAQKALASDEAYVRAHAQGTWIHSLSARNLVILHSEVGKLWTDSFRRMPASTRFFSGGALSVRGFPYQSLGARDSLGNVIGGEVAVLGSLEYEYRFMPRWGGAVFYDIGNAMRSFNDPLEQSVGIGARWTSPFGRVRIDFGFPLTSDRGQVEFHLAVGSRI
jgi:translocation and assembly module TamA